VRKDLCIELFCTKPKRNIKNLTLPYFSLLHSSATNTKYLRIENRAMLSLYFHLARVFSRQAK